MSVCVVLNFKDDLSYEELTYAASWTFLSKN